MDHSDTTKINLKRSGKFAPCSNFFSGNTNSENILTIQDQSTSGDTSSLTFNVDLKLAIDNDNSIHGRNSNTNILIRQTVTDMDADTENTNRNLSLTHQMDKLSELFLKY